MIFSHVKISSFRAKAHLVFHWCLYNKSGYQILDGCLIDVTTMGELSLQGLAEPKEGQGHLIEVAP